MKSLPVRTQPMLQHPGLSPQQEREQTLTRLRTGEANQGGRPIARRQSISGDDPAVQRLQQQVSDLSQQVDKARAKDDLEAAPGDFSMAVHRHLFSQRRFEKAATADLFGDHSWMRMRRAQLHNTPGGGPVAAAQYGMGFAHDDVSGKPPHGRLEIGNGMNGYYQRMAPSGNTLHTCQALYQMRYPQAKAQPRLFVNSPFMAHQVVGRFKAMHRNSGEVKGEVVAPGIVAISCGSEGEWHALEKLVDAFGARPSAYQVARSLVATQGNEQPPVADARIHNHQQIGLLRQPHPQGVLAQLRSVPDALSTATLAKCDADMIDDLAKMLSLPNIAPHIEHNPLVAQGLKGMRFIAESMPALAQDSTRFGNAHRALMEEMQIVLSQVRPYSDKTWKMMASQRIRDGLPTEQAKKMLPPEPCLMSSGMQALTQGLETALASGKGGLKPLTNGNKRSQFYYEAQEHADSFRQPIGSELKHTPALYTSLADSFVSHHSQPERNWTLNDITAGIEKEIAGRRDKTQPLNVVLDATIEKEGEMKALLTKLGPALANNQLRLFVCKSQQKFANLGASKTLGGSLTLLGAKTEENEKIQGGLQSYEKQQGWYNNDEFQLMAHITRAAVKHEPAMLKTATDNGNFVAEHCFHGKDGHARFAGHDPSKPFAMLNRFDEADNSRWPGMCIDSDDGTDVLLPVENMLNRDLIRQRGSFGFTESNVGNISALPGYDDDMLRLSFGQENKAELIERFWMASREMQLDRPALTTQDALKLATGLIDKALSADQKVALKDAPLSEKLRQVAHNEASTPSDDQRARGNVTELRGQQAVPQGFTINKVASIVSHMNHLLDKMDMTDQMSMADDRQPLHELLRGLLESGMQGVSRTAREHAASLQCALSFEDMFSDEQEMRRFGAENLALTLERSHLSPASAVFQNVIPDQAWDEQPEAMKDRLINATFGRMDTNAQLEYIHRHLSGGDGVHFLEECAQRLAGQLKNTSPAESRQHWQATLNEAMLRRGIIKPAAPGSVPTEQS